MLAYRPFPQGTGISLGISLGIRGSVVPPIIVIFATPAEAYQAASEIKRLYTAVTWGDIEIRRLGERAEMTVPPAAWRDPRLRELLQRFGGTRTS